MKAKLIFNLPEEQEEFDRAIRGIDYYIAIQDFAQVMRGHLKYDTNSQWDTKTVDDLWNQYWEIMGEFEE
jgi:hypothetical protein